MPRISRCAPAWFDPAETPGIVTPFMLLYALHDGLVKPMPGNPAEPCLAESYTASADGLDPQLRAARRRHVPQWRAGDGGGREILLRALSRQRRALHQGEGGGGGDARSAARRLPSAPAVARFPASTIPASPARAGSCRRNTSRASARTASRRRRSARGRTSSSRFTPGRRTGDGGVRRLLAQGARP